MSETQFVAALCAIIGVTMSIIGFLLSAKDKKQQEEINDLKEKNMRLEEKMERDKALHWQRYDTLRKDFDEFRIKIAAEHYIKDELDGKFNKLEATISEGLKELGGKFDRVSTTFASMLNHLPTP